MREDGGWRTSIIYIHSINIAFILFSPSFVRFLVFSAYPWLGHGPSLCTHAHHALVPWSSVSLIQAPFEGLPRGAGKALGLRRVCNATPEPPGRAIVLDP